ncbi:hypothetical protein ACQEVZ_08305 [Dactylosporangium sp. CA-152071]|uniref:hypothetical protein n=1 Tax=Dactylosporangium sp. CA-152071 TaxID=3239933 RepID=UPI003D8B89AD
MVAFDVVLRGYDRRAVDALMRAVEAAAGDRDRIAAAVRAAGRLPVVLRGYSPVQVDAWLAASRTAEPEPGAGPAPVWAAAVELPVVLRGYRPAETDALLTLVAGAIASGDAARRADALRAIGDAHLPVAFRGFDRAAVDAWLARAAHQLRGR